MNIYELVRESVKTRRQWPSGHAETLWQDGRYVAEIREGGRDGGGQLFLIFSNGNGLQTSAIAGHLSYSEGWVFTLHPDEYQGWVARARRLVK